MLQKYSLPGLLDWLTKAGSTVFILGAKRTADPGGVLRWATADK